jgi:hypothetical protein
LELVKRETLLVVPLAYYLLDLATPTAALMETPVVTLATI